jgi:hypothetical protein
VQHVAAHHLVDRPLGPHHFPLWRVVLHKHVVSLSSCPVLLASEMSGSIWLLHYNHLGGG